MELIKHFVQGLILFAGIAMLVGGSFCSIKMGTKAFTEDSDTYFLFLAIPLFFTLYGIALIYSLSMKAVNKSNNIMNLTTFLQKIQNAEFISFNETIGFIDENYNYQPTEFSNGLNEDKLISPAGVNQGSCKIFAFAQLHNLTPEQTLSLFGDYYHIDVLQNPDANDHQNIRNFMKYGWKGISFQNQPLAEK